MRKWLPWLSLGIALLLFAIQVWIYWDFVIDDAFITFRYVRQWTHGNGLVYNIGERVEGYSNFLWIVMLAPFDCLGVDLVWAAKGMGIVFSLLTLCLTWHIGRQFSLGVVAPLLLGASGPFAAWAGGGLETPLFTFLLIVSGYVFVREEERAKGWISGLLFALLALSRPEGLLFALIPVIIRIWTICHNNGKPEARDWLRVAGFLVIFFPFFLWRLYYYGYPLPNTVYAKSLGLHPRAFLEGSYYLFHSFNVAGGLFFVGFFSIIALKGSERPLLTNYMVISAVIYGIFLLISGGDWMPMQRFAVHIFPFVFLLVGIGLTYLSRAWRGVKAALLTALVIGQGGFLLASSLEERFVANPGLYSYSASSNVISSADYLRERVRPTDTIAVVDAGRNAYRLPLETRVIDMVGLTDAYIARRPVQMPGGLFGRGDGFGKWDVEYVLAQNPRFVQLHLLGQSAEGEWLTDFTGTTLLVNHPAFRARYVQIRGVDSAVFMRRE